MAGHLYSNIDIEQARKKYLMEHQVAQVARRRTTLTNPTDGDSHAIAILINK